MRVNEDMIDHIFWTEEKHTRYEDMIDHRNLNSCEIEAIGLISQLVEHRTSITEVLDSNPIQVWISFRLQFHNYLSCIHDCDDQSCLQYVSPQFNKIFLCIHFYSSLFMGILRIHKVASSQWLDSSVSRALHRFRRVIEKVRIPFKS